MGSYFCKETYPVAEKVLYCYLCGHPIVPGQVHIKRVGVFEGDFSWIRMHIACEDVTKAWGDEYWENHDITEFRELIAGKEPRIEIWIIDERRIG